MDILLNITELEWGEILLRQRAFWDVVILTNVSPVPRVSHEGGLGFENVSTEYSIGIGKLSNYIPM